LAKADQLVFRNRPIDLARIRQPLYAVGAIQDHICPWNGTFASCALTGGPVRYVLADEGHIAGIVNPPSERSKKKYWAAPATRRKNPEKWLAKQTPARGSWWTDWVNWLKPASGPQGPPPPMGSSHHPPLEPAPGLYVRQ
jgi:polyhydroxyalkanoate synthase